MDILIQIFKQLPPFWPRLALVAVVLLLLMAPQARRWAKRAGLGDQQLARTKELLALRKLEIEVAALRQAHPDVEDSPLDEELRRSVAALVGEEVAVAEPIPWPERLRLAAMGTGTILVLGLLAVWLSGRKTGGALGWLALYEATGLAPCALIASALPARVKWAPVLYGVVMPIVVAAVVVAARGN